MDINRLGKYDFSQITIPEPFAAGRIAAVFKDKYRVFSAKNDLLAEVTGKMIYNEDFPAVGDWVVLDEVNAIITDILPRKSLLSRKRPGDQLAEQVIAANIDYIFITTSLNKEFNLSRLERYLTIVLNSGAVPVFILNKIDIASDIEDKYSQLQKLAGDLSIHLISALQDQGLDQLDQYFKEHNTIALIGSSGVGKSTLLNKLIGEQIQEVGDIREDDDKGRHVTTRRELFLLPEAIIIDTPGMREIQIWESAVEDAFADITEIAAQCKFNDCQHQSEPGCAVKAAIECGELATKRFENYQKMAREQLFVDQKKNLSHKIAEKEKLNRMMGDYKLRKKIKNRPEI